MIVTEKDAARFWTHVRKSEGCWLWDHPYKAGYGAFQIGRRPIAAHRVSWMIANGPIPERAMVLHSCDVRACVRPDHLSIGDAHQNMQDAIARGRRPKRFDPLISLRSAALELGVHPDTLRQQIHHGKLAATMLGGWHVRLTEMERYRRESRRG